MSRASRHVIVRDEPFRMGKTRSEVSKNLERDGWGSGLTEEQKDKAEYFERKTGVPFPKQHEIDRVR